MRTTITFDDEVAAAVEKVRQERGVGVSEAVNDLIRVGLASRPRAHAFRQRSAALGIRIDVSNVVEALDLLDADDPLR